MRWATTIPYKLRIWKISYIWRYRINFGFGQTKLRNQKSKLDTSDIDLPFCIDRYQNHLNCRLCTCCHYFEYNSFIFSTLFFMFLTTFNNSQIDGINLTCRKKFTSCFHIYTPIFLSYVSSNRFLAQAITYSASSIMIVMWKEFSFGRWNFIKFKSL